MKDRGGGKAQGAEVNNLVYTKRQNRLMPSAHTRLLYSLFGPFLFFYYHFNTFRGEKDKEGKHVFLSINQFVVYSPNLGTLVGTPKRVVSTIVSRFLFDDFQTVEHIPTKYNFLYNVINAEREKKNFT